MALDLNTEKLQFLAQKNYDLDLQGALRKATGLNLDTLGIFTALWGPKLEGEWLARATQVLSNRALLLSGATGTFMSTPDAAALDTVGDIDIRVELVPKPQTGFRILLAKWAPAANQSYMFSRNFQFNNVDLFHSTTGANSLDQISSAPPLVPQAFRVTMDVDNGATQHVKTYFHSDSMDGTWTQISTHAIAGVTSIFSGNAELRLGTDSGGGSRFTGRITRAQVRSGINGTIVANPDMRALTPGQTSFTDSAGLLWTLQGGAKIV